MAWLLPLDAAATGWLLAWLRDTSTLLRGVVRPFLMTRSSLYLRPAHELDDFALMPFLSHTAYFPGVSLFLTRVELNDSLVYENSASK